MRADDADDLRGPIPTQMVSNGEYLPNPQTQKQKEVEFRIKELAERVSKKLGISRRKFLGSSGGIAASFIAMNEAHGAEFFKVSKEEMFEPDAHAKNAPPRDLFVFDDQLHTIRSSRTGVGFSSTPMVRSPCTFEWPRTGQMPAPGLPILPRISSRFAIC